MKVGILPLGRSTFDIAYAEDKLAKMLMDLNATGHEVIGPTRLLLSQEATRAELPALHAADMDLILILQVTFTDASIVATIASDFRQPLAIWSIPEPRLGRRLRLNSLCGLNLASHALGRLGHDFGWLYADPADDVAGALAALLAGRRQAGRRDPGPVPAATLEGRAIATSLGSKRIGRIGDHPAGFDTCGYDPSDVELLTGVEVDRLELEDLFAVARAAPASSASALRAELARELDGLDAVNQTELDRSLRLKLGLEELHARDHYDAFAIRCWPETFTEYGGAVCGPAAMMSEARVPCACEADVYGALTQLVLMLAADAPVFLTDLVDMDPQDNTGVVWHCGQAPISMRDPTGIAEATVHSNRRKPLLYQFALKPGPVTFLRISQSHNRPCMVIAFGEMLRRPMSFTGTSGVVRFERTADEVLNDIISSGLEHHMALTYGDHRDVLRGVAGAIGLEILEL